MRYVYARFKGYIGFYNGMGLDEIVIDFSKCKNKICIISGKNGSGKSTLLNSLHPLPDNSSMYIPNAHAEKELHLLDGQTLYQILIVSACNGSGNRATTKAYFKKNGLELNPNGNISSYKDILFSEFELDPSYLELTKLSMDDKGIVSKKPGERKRFIANTLNSLETYNSMNKTFSKKANIFKSYINNVSSKMRSIGDEESLHSSLFNIENRFKLLQDKKSNLEKSIVEAETFIKVADPDGLIQDKYTLLYQQVSDYSNQLKQLESEEILYTSKYSDISDIDLEISKTSQTISKLQSDIESKEAKIKDILDRREEDLHVLDIKRQKLDNLLSDFEIDNLRNTVQTLRNRIKSQERIFNDSKITNFDVSRDEYINIFSTMKRIKSMIITFRDRPLNVISQAISIFRTESKMVLMDNIEVLKTKLRECEDSINETTQNIMVNRNSLSIMEILTKRPKECKIDTCPLIENAINVQKTNPQEAVDFFENLKTELIDSKSTMESALEEMNNVLIAYNELCNIIDTIRYNTNMKKVDISYILFDLDELFNRIENNNPFNEIEDGDVYLDRAEIIESYRDDRELLIKLEADLKIAENKQFTVNEMISEIASIESELSNAADLSESLTKEISFNSSLLIDYQKRLSELSSWKSIKDSKDNISKNKESALSEYRSIKNNLESIKKYIDIIGMANDELISIENELSPLEEQKKLIEYSLISLQECKNEFEMYNEKYTLVNKLKSYSNPTADCIQTIFIDMYMSETLTLANQLLSLLFCGEYRLLKYIINGDEFRLPFIGTGIEVDDVSNGSGSQVAMMGMIINFVLFFQGSTKYNIASSDELDETLDTYNRIQYNEVLYKVTEILGIEQCFVISHSPEINRSNMDVIQLAEYNQTDCYGDGNIIFNYYNL